MSWQLRRDILIVGFSLTAAAYEIVEGGGRPSVLTFLSGLLLSPLVIRVDELRRTNQHNRRADDGGPKEDSIS